jgi:uncharacterized membrane protein YsdA (DUF1294 family)
MRRFGDNAVELGKNIHAAVWLAYYAKDSKVTERKDWRIREKKQSAKWYKR